MLYSEPRNTETVISHVVQVARYLGVVDRRAHNDNWILSVAECIE